MKTFRQHITEKLSGRLWHASPQDKIVDILDSGYMKGAYLGADFSRSIGFRSVYDYTVWQEKTGYTHGVSFGRSPKNDFSFGSVASISSHFANLVFDVSALSNKYRFAHITWSERRRKIDRSETEEVLLSKSEKVEIISPKYLKEIHFYHDEGVDVTKVIEKLHEFSDTYDIYIHSDKNDALFGRNGIKL